MELSPRWRKALLTVHVATAVSWLGADVVLVTLGAAGLTGNTAVYRRWRWSAPCSCR
jgi:hypothetical protein